MAKRFRPTSTFPWVGTVVQWQLHLMSQKEREPMAALYGRMQGARGEVTRTGTQRITAKLETWNGSIAVELDKDGTFSVRIGDKHYPSIEIATGNVDEQAWHPGMSERAKLAKVEPVEPGEPLVVRS